MRNNKRKPKKTIKINRTIKINKSKRKNKTSQTKKINKTKIIMYVIIVLMALISITATYAWFSVQRDGIITGFNVKIEVSETLEISLDGETWTHNINIENMKQLYGTYQDKDTSTVAHQAQNGQQRNYIPIELLPVSTVGNLQNGNLVFVIGELDGQKLTEIKKCSEEDITTAATTKTKEDNNKNHPYLAFDMYLRNLSRLTENGREDPLQLNEGSIVTATKEGTGLEYSVRVAFVKYGSTADLSGTGAQVRSLSANGNEKVAIWEPNYKGHTQFVVQTDDRIDSTIQEIDTYAVKDNVGGAVPNQIHDITDTTDSALEKVYTNRPAQAENEAVSATIEPYTLKQIDGRTELGLEPNQITKVRVYLWVEGQDPDCIDLSSTGQELNATIRLIKPEYRQLITNTYN